MKHKNLRGALYFATFIDGFSRKLWCFAMKSKDQVFQIFKNFHASVERKTGNKQKYIRVHNSSEYRGKFEQYFHDHGIMLRGSVPKIPQHIGVD